MDNLIHHEPTRDGYNKSLWQTSTSAELHPAGNAGEKIYDTLIVGAGITGITLGLLLQKSGQQCMIADAHQAGYGTTGGTSAHINTFADTTYAEVESAFNQDAARLFAKVIADAVSHIHEQVQTHDIDCDFEWKNGYVYSQTEEETKQLKDLFESALRAGVSAEVTENPAAPLPFKKAVVFDQQAQFHPLKYILALQKEFTNRGGIVLENTMIDTVDSEEDYHIARSGKTEIKARNVVYATHIPPGGINLLHFLNAPYRSYVVAVTLTEERYPDALVYDMQDPYHYFRTHTIDGQKYLVAGGHDHKTAHGDEEQSFSDLIDYVKKCYPVKEITHKWSAQYFVPADGLPYIGHLPGASKGIYTATGFNGNGVILGTASALVISDLILHGKSECEKIFDPGRVKPFAGFTEIVKENADVVKRFVGDRIAVDEIASLADIPAGSGQVVEYQKQKVGIYKNENGVIEALDPICSHAKCVVQWNKSEKSWDCPCHGARFNAQGEVLTGPARENLQKIGL